MFCLNICIQRECVWLITEACAIKVITQHNCQKHGQCGAVCPGYKGFEIRPSARTHSFSSDVIFIFTHSNSLCVAQYNMTTNVSAVPPRYTSWIGANRRQAETTKLVFYLPRCLSRKGHFVSETHQHVAWWHYLQGFFCVCDMVVRVCVIRSLIWCTWQLFTIYVI